MKYLPIQEKTGNRRRKCNPFINNLQKAPVFGYLIRMEEIILAKKERSDKKIILAKKEWSDKIIISRKKNDLIRAQRNGHLEMV